MRPPRLALLTCSFVLALACVPALLGGELLHAPMPSGATASSSACCDLPPPCPAPAPSCCPSPKVVVEMSQPEVRFTAPPCRSSAPCQAEQAQQRSKMCSFFNVNISKTKSQLVGGVSGAALQPVTSIVPAYATATIPIAFQTTRFAAVGTEFGLAGVGRREFAAGEFSRSDVEEMVRDAVRREAALQRDGGRRTEAALQNGDCAELKARIEKVEQRLGQIEKQVEGIVTKINKLP
jgi:hypothetical protein